MEIKQDSCCSASPKKGTSLLQGILYGILPHTFCIAFVLFSIIGSVAVTAIFKNLLMIPYFFTFLIITSFVFATFSAFIYLKKTDCLCFSGVKKKWKYLSVLYTTMILVNLSLFIFVFPALANINSGDVLDKEKYNANLSISVEIPCSGHASLVIDELKKNDGVGQVLFKMPNIFDLQYNPAKTSPEKILLSEIFGTYKATRK
jgi:hypothetical protein